MNTQVPAVGSADPLALLAHELRSPLAAMVGMADAMRTQALGPLPSAYAEYARLIHQTGLHMIAVLAVLGRLAPTSDEAPVPAREAIRDGVESFRPQAATRGVRIALDLDGGDGEGGRAMAHRRVLGQILFNLLDNALRHTPGGGTVEVRAGQDGGQITLEIRNPPGAAAEADSPREGAGLGLAIVRGLCAAHRGEFVLETTGAGATARARLSAAQP
jgi:cell cycle sensor histidine kinase DivJ